MMDAILTDIGTWLQSIGPWAYVFAPLLMMMVAIVPIPAEIPALLNGLMFGPWICTLITWGGALVGAQISFELARKWGRPLAERFVPAKSLHAVDGALDRGDWWGILLPRFIPILPFTAIDWGLGLTTVPRWRFFWTTAVGILPGAFAFTATGAGLPFLMERFPVATWGTAGALVLFGVYKLWATRTSRKAEVPVENEAAG